MDNLADLASAVPASSATVMVHFGFSDPKSPLRIPAVLPASLRVALVAQLGVRGGTVIDSPQGLVSLHHRLSPAVQAAIDVLSAGTSLLVDDTAPLLLRAVLVSVKNNSELARATAISRAVQVLRLSRDHTLLLSRELYEQLDSGVAERTRLAVSPATVDAYPELADLFDLDWRAGSLSAAPVISSVPTAAPASSGERLELSHGGVQLSIAAHDCPLTLGRDKSCGLHLEGDAASRLHGRIEFMQGQFYLVDASRNGTYLLTPQGEEVFLRGERLPLSGHGVISPGAPIVKQTGEVVRYVCRSPDEMAALMATLIPPPAQAQLTH